MTATVSIVTTASAVNAVPTCGVVVSKDGCAVVAFFFDDVTIIGVEFSSFDGSVTSFDAAVEPVFDVPSASFFVVLAKIDDAIVISVEVVSSIDAVVKSTSDTTDAVTAADGVVLASFDEVVSMADRDEANKIDASVVASEFWSLVVTISVFPSVNGTDVSVTFV